MNYLETTNQPEIDPSSIVCVALAHNEALLLPEFLAHYRALGVTHFLFVNDRSTDETNTLLNQAEDVSVFTPREGSTYKDHKRFWRAELLDTYCDGKWCVVPDVDEHLVYRNMNTRALASVTQMLEREGANAVQATMIDMYSETPLDKTTYSGGGLAEAFPFFDGPEHHYRVLTPSRFQKKYATPDHMVIGGLRQRLFMPISISGNSWPERFFRNASNVEYGNAFQGNGRFKATLAKALVKSRLKSQILFNQTKVPLVRWKAGLFYYNGAHALSQPMVLSNENMGLLHYCVATGTLGFENKAARGEHANGSEYYRKMLQGDEARKSSPVFEGTRTYIDENSLGKFMGNH